MRRPHSPRLWRRAALAAALLAAGGADCFAIEMFTYFGDGSRIGLPSLEVPIEAYPGIPLRSDRLRARRRAMRAGPAAAVQVGPRGQTPGITIRSLPTTGANPAVQPRSRPAPVVIEAEPEPSRPAEPLLAPEPDAAPLPAEVTPPSGS